MLPLKEKDKPIVQKLLSAGCCARCILRFCCIRVQATYRRPQQDTLEELQTFIHSAENSQSHDAAAPETSGENNQSHDAAAPETSGENNKSHDAAAAAAVTEAPQEPPSKRAKLEPSGTNAASEGGDGNAAAAPRIAAGVKAEKYEFDSLVLSVSLPAQLCVREHSCWLHVKKEVREKGLVLDKDDIIPLKEAFKWIMQGLVSKELGGAVVVTKSALEVGVEFTHKETDADCHFLATVCPDCFKPAKNKQFESMVLVFPCRHFPCPPTQPSSCCSPQGVQCLHLSVFVAGRYNKFCRSLPQTPWLIDGERRMESSVEELIAAPVLSTFRAEGFNFSSSGREDVDVRTLGNGRPFAMELLNPHRSRLSRMEMKQLQQTINKSSDKIRVRDLQIVTRRPIQREDISFIGDIKELTLDQKTPLRVLHRRALAVRQRVVHSMNVHFLDPHHFHLRLKTQAGTYIKEFVHGDFGRTKPNLCELLRTDADILELDVESVDVDWPPAIPE
ncbi:putative tRNA pseudouridine synthase Pus10 [Scophthalmus maximus]|uniref:tRNA pseudouridine(55) synthase n=1 Tax=Scophthalmus maximus TaxID=52904 RepID=A0A2U9BLY1_SCOMX|nr:putative tRNA pseudouridine synthase Pus10 [Scophthalmus maximus]